MAWLRITLQLLLTAALTAAVDKRKDIHTPNHTLGDDGDYDYGEGDAVTEVGRGAADPGHVVGLLQEAELEAEAEKDEEDDYDEDDDYDAALDLNLKCSEDAFAFNLPAGPMTEVKLVGLGSALVNTTKPCRYEVRPQDDTVTVPFKGCHGQVQTGQQYTLQVSYIGEQGRTVTATLSCANGTAVVNPRARQQAAKCDTPPADKAQNCGLPVGEQVRCGDPGITTAACEQRGCCVDLMTFACYYPLDECTVDKHFVFAIRPDSASVAIDTTSLVIPGHPGCVPVIVDPTVAIYKFPLTDCGSHSYEVGDTMIYMVQVHTMVEVLNLKYGMISRSDAVRFMIECRYPKSGAVGKPLSSVGFQVKIPTLSFPASVVSQGLFGVELRLAKDRLYSSYYATDSLPLKVLLGAPVYLELNLVAAKAGGAELVVNYCVAFPQNAENALVLVYEGCANPNDVKVSILSVVGDTTNKKQRRFMVQAFQFMDIQSHQYLDEQIYFMCSTSVCIEEPCDQGCFSSALWAAQACRMAAVGVVAMHHAGTSHWVGEMPFRHPCCTTQHRTTSRIRTTAA
ncbi:Zona pellucida sperm-binding protein 4 [Merluccius polli]|uniref:Zona pellucida sperm-binding protein 4 n=1 Tax=Merluccius polli TaxID=89951 RepID=A0AA47MA46_MERPO|nr:Zona pellucida sperm-binding protein 4 [Merluccius polli]